MPHFMNDRDTLSDVQKEHIKAAITEALAPLVAALNSAVDRFDALLAADPGDDQIEGAAIEPVQPPAPRRLPLRK